MSLPSIAPRWTIDTDTEAQAPPSVFRTLLEHGYGRAAALIVFDQQANPLYVSPAADRLLQRRDWRGPGTQATQQAEPYDWLVGAIRRAARAGDEGPILRLPHGNGELQLRVRSLGGGHAVMLMRERGQDPRVCRSLLRRTYRLTETEAALAAALAEGVSVGGFARERGMSVLTARTHLKRVFLKLGVNSQSDLIREILLGFALQ